MLRRLATSMYRRRRWVLVAWIVGVVGLTMIAGNIGDDFAESFEVKGTESADAQTLLKENFPERAGDSGQP